MSFDRADIALRLVEERSRIGYSQRDFADKLGISAETLRRYEIGQSRLDAELLAKSAGYGIDVQYVLTGIKSANLQDAEDANAPAVPPRVNESKLVVKQNSGNLLMKAEAGSTVNNIVTNNLKKVTIAKTSPGIEHISESQASRLTELVAEVVRLEEITKKAPKGYRSIWSSLNSHCKVASYRLLPLEKFSTAETYLLKWIGRLNSTTAAEKSDNSSWRNRKYAYIKVNTNSEFGKRWLVSKLSEFGVQSLTELTDESLDKVYRSLSSARSRNKSKE
jgi:transcriptional regulator with XRE-family HTH domain